MFVNTRKAVLEMIHESRLPISHVANLAGMRPNSIFRLKRDPNSKCRSYNVEKIAEICGYKVQWDKRKPDECNIHKIDIDENLEEMQTMNGFTNEIEKLADRIADYKMQNQMKDQQIQELKDKLETINLENDDKIDQFSNYQSQCKMEVRLNGVSLESRLIDIDGKDACSLYLGYTIQELNEMWKPEEWFKFGKHPINNLFHKESPTKLESARLFVQGALKMAKTAFMSNETFALPITYQHKDGSKVLTTLYFEFNISEKMATIKTRFHNGTH
tara:strand:- start:2479 stop:3297 length:819 start_codon:yes stop_codon:yes gene_type:complete